MSGPSPLYAQTAGAPIAAPELTGHLLVETVVIGAGFTGLSAGLHLAQAGRSVAVLDRHEPGWGASGRNGGQVNPGLKPDPDDVARRFGGARGERMVEAAWHAPDLVFSLIAQHAIDCDARRGGTLRAAADRRDLPGLERLASQCAGRGMDVSLLDNREVAQRVGSARYLAALLDRRGGQINPLAYARGLARATLHAGGRVHASSPVLRLKPDGAGWRVSTPNGSVRADRVVIATNGYSDAVWPRLRESIVPVYSAIIASTELPDAHRAAILAQGEVLYELGDLTTYYRVDAQGRLLIGGRSTSRDLRGAAFFPFLARHAAGLWPELGRIGWEHGWNGQLAMTTDHYPHWHEPANGIFACLGYNGRGVAMATLLGRELARRIQGAEADAILLPPTPIEPIRLHRGWRAGVSARLAYGRFRAATAGWR